MSIKTLDIIKFCNNGQDNYFSTKNNEYAIKKIYELGEIR